MPSAFKSPLRNEIKALQKENGAATIGEHDASSGDFGYDEDVFSRLKVAQDSLIEELECKIVVSSVVGQAVLKGIVRALTEESADLLAEKDAEIRRLNDLVEEKHRVAEDSTSQLNKIASEYFDRLKESEICMLEKERELAKMAENLVDLTFRLQGESLNNLSLEKKMKDVVIRDSGNQRKASALSEEIENLKRERSSEAEMLRREIRLKEVRHREQIEEMMAENEAQLAALREENSEQVSTISALAANQEVVNDEVCQLIEAQKESMEAIEGLRMSLEEQKMQHEQEVDILLDVYQKHIEEVSDVQNRHAGDSEEAILHNQEVEILDAYYSSLVASFQPDFQHNLAKVDQGSLKAEDGIDKSGKSTSSLEELWVNTRVNEVETEIILDCYAGFTDDVRETLCCIGLEKEQAVDFCISLEEVRQNPDCWRSRKRRTHPAANVQESLLEQNYQHQLEMDILLDFFVNKLNELYGFVMKRSEIELSQDKLGVEDQECLVHLADLQRENATLRREKDQVLVEKTEEMFRLKRDFFKKLDQLKLDGGQYEFGILKRQFADSRQKLDRILDRKQGDFGACNEDTDSASSQGESNDFGRFTEDFPLLVSELQNDIEQLILDTGMAKPEDSGQKFESRHEFNLEYESAFKALEEERRRSLELTTELQELEHNINLSNGELERLLRQIEAEKQARLQKEGELQNVKHDVNLVKRQLEVVQGQLESERLQKKRLETEMHNLQNHIQLSNQRVESLQKELNDVLKVKASISEDHKKLRWEVFLLHQGVRNEVRRSMEQQELIFSGNFKAAKQGLEEKDARLLKAKDRLNNLAQYIKAKNSAYKRNLSTCFKNLRTAEEEVDLLGDENDYLVSLLEKVFIALDNYSPMLQHDPGIASLAKVIKEELVSRVAPS